jgi:hypothetical protein
VTDSEPETGEKPEPGEKPGSVETSVKQFRRFATAVCVVGMLVQLLLTAYYLGMGHKAAPHDLPVGLVAGADQRESITAMLEENGAFGVDDYASAEVLTTAIRRREVYGRSSTWPGRPGPRRRRCCAPPTTP